MADDVMSGADVGQNPKQLFLGIDGDNVFDIVREWLDRHKSGGVKELKKEWPELQKELRQLARELSVTEGRPVQIIPGQISRSGLAWLIAILTEEDSKDEVIHDYFSRLDSSR